MDKNGTFRWIFIVLIISMIVGLMWDQVPIIKNLGHNILDPSAGKLLNWNINIGMILIVLIISLIMTLFQKYMTDQKALKELKGEQKKLQEEMKKHKDNPKKLMEFNQKQMELFWKMWPMTMRPLVYTGVPIVLFFRWFNDYFSSSAFEGFRFLGFFSWFWYYFILTIIFSMILRKLMDVE